MTVEYYRCVIFAVLHKSHDMEGLETEPVSILLFCYMQQSLQDYHIGLGEQLSAR